MPVLDPFLWKTPAPGAMESSARSDDDAAPLVQWLVEQALPIWQQVGVDRHQGGFFEKIDLEGRAVEEPRRARVVARQIYVFATAARHGWMTSADACVEHGLRFLLEKMRTAEGVFAAAVRPDGALVRSEFDLYEHAFVLFALASARRDRPDRGGLQDEAEALLGRLRGRWAHPLAGFEEAVPRTLPLKSNPHMHLFEAALEWLEVADESRRGPWQALADELAGLCLARFVDPASGALREYFDADWRPAAGAPGRVVEPGHQFEWAWLLMRWARSAVPGAVAEGAAPAATEPAGGVRPAHADALATAKRLIGIGEAHGVDRLRGVAVNALDDDLCVVDGAAKLWPQTERIKAWHEMTTCAADAGQAALARQSLGEAAAGMRRYFLTSPAGLWHEELDADGRFILQHCRASSLYHIVCAIETLHGERSATSHGSAAAAVS